MPSPFTSIKRRLRHLRNGEAINLFILPSVFIWLWKGADASVNWFLRVLSLVVLLYILFQGSLYWHLKLRAVSERIGMPGYFRPLFRFFRQSNIGAIVGMSLLITFAAFRGYATTADVVWFIGLTGFALAEHMNYYVYQFSDLIYLRRHRRLRKAALAVDLKSSSYREGAA